jgi:hypothetical protein
MKLIDTVKPSDINISNDLMGSNFNKYEKEIIAKNIIIISKKNKNKWFEFSFKEYKKRPNRGKITIQSLQVI